jgi:type VI secretion system secreted protein Hcp
VAAIDYFLKVDGISGESRDSKHKGEIEVLSFSFGETHPGSSGPGGGAGGGAGKVQMSDFTFTARTSKASPQLFQHCAQGKHIKQALLTVRKAGGTQQEYLKIKLNDVLVSSYALSSGGDDPVPDDSFSLRFRRISYDYAPQKADGSLDVPVHGGWDLTKNVKI